MILDPVAFLIVFGDHGERRAVVLERPAAENLAVRLHGVITPLVPQPPRADTEVIQGAAAIQ